MIADPKFESSAAFFEIKYQQSADPWDFSKNTYELERYDTMIRAIADRRYRRAFEPGCSIGVLTERLAAHCDAVDANDFSPTAAAKARVRCSHLPHVEVRCAAMPEVLPTHESDLLVLSEIGYYFTAHDWREITVKLIEAIPQGAIVLAAHWLGHSPDHCISGDDVHEILGSHPRLHIELKERHRSFRLDRWVRL